MDAGHQITQLIGELKNGDQEAWDRLLPLVYEELRRIAHRQLARQGDGHTLDTGALVHEAFLKLVDQARLPYETRTEFFAISSRAMRQVLIDYARRHRTARRGGDWRRVGLDEEEIAVEQRAEVLLSLDEALSRLSVVDERLGRVVECRFFGGMTEEETAAALGVTDRTVRRDWTKARVWLYAEMSREPA
jgi:RNA polymerase sigma factor (TIGR02999 family)